MSTSHHAANGGISADAKKAIGIALRMTFDWVMTVGVVVVLWMAIDFDLVLWTAFAWTGKAMAEGFVNVARPLMQLNAGAAAGAVLDNLVSFATFGFLVNTGIIVAIALVAYAFWRSHWLGGTMLGLSLIMLAWFVAMWALQLLGPLVFPLVITIVALGVVVVSAKMFVKWAWNLAEDSHH